MKHEHNGLMVMAAVRYCLGRMTYIVRDCRIWLIQIWPELPEHTKTVIKRDIEEEFTRDDEARAQGKTQWLPLGWDCDRAEWERVRKLWTDRSGGE